MLFTTTTRYDILHLQSFCISFFFHDPPTTEIYTLSLHDALPICHDALAGEVVPERHVAKHHREARDRELDTRRVHTERMQDRKSTRLNSSHGYISYAVFCLKKKKKQSKNTRSTTPKSS